MSNRLTILACGIVLLSACSEEPPPRSITEFVEKPILLEAAMVRCSRNRDATRYDAECINAREAVKRIETKEEAAHRAELEAESEAKRRALRRTQTAAAEARRRAAAAEQRRKEEEYLAQFGVPAPAPVAENENEELTGNTPLAVIPDGPAGDELETVGPDPRPASDGGNAPTVSEDPETNLESVRDELQRRAEEDGN